DLSTHHEKNAHLDHSKSSTHSNALTVSIKVLYDGEDVVKTCRVEKFDDDDEEDEDDYEEGKKEKKKEKKKGKKLCHKVRRCKKKSKICLGGINPKDGFKCKKKFIKLNKVLSSAEAACKRLRSNSDRNMPKLYTASEFKAAPGPYLEWRIYNKYLNFGLKQQYRLVMTKKCAVVGAVVRNKDTSYTTCKFGPK
ncbi:putative secreted effector protein, partial [Golovinomyces cichoracearum]